MDTYINPIDRDILGEKGVLCKDGGKFLFVFTEAIRNGNGDILYLICADGTIVPWDAIVFIQPFKEEDDKDNG